jgi:lipid A ethanolaminephosphotransferase
MSSFFRGSTLPVLGAAVVFVVCYNAAFFRNALVIYPFRENPVFFLSFALLLTTTIALFLSLVLNRLTFKPVLVLLFPLAAMAAYFMDSYNVVIDDSMIRNSAMTDMRETGDLLNARLLLYFFGLGVLPAWLVYRWKVQCRPFRQELAARAKLILLLVVLIGGNMFVMSEEYAGFIREHKALRYYSNPLSMIYGASRFLNQEIGTQGVLVRQPVGLDAHVTRTDTRRKLLILVAGEAARGDHWQLNGYERNTNPLLAAEDVVSFTNAHSCATSTAYSLPCMFSAVEQSDFDLQSTLAQENVLDVLAHAGAHVLWRDNNSDSKGVATGVAFADFRSPDVNPACDTECRDVGMLSGLDAFIRASPTGDVVVVLHQMGNHGPAYFKRYPDAFETFTPTCNTNELSACTQEEIRNAYDNALVYTDYFLTQVIGFLKPYEGEFATSMLYMSDHGESLGEYGVYLHGLPYRLAPEAQTHVSAFFWRGQPFTTGERAALAQGSVQPVSHDNYFHTVLGLLDVETSVYKPSLDMLSALAW